MASNFKIKIAARLRPRIEGEVDDGGIQVVREEGKVESSGTSSITVPNPRDDKQIFKFPFSSCYDHNSKQEEIFRNDVEPMLDVVYTGVTVTIFAYGVTSSGKTHTMQGTKTDPGIIPRVVQAMFDHPARTRFETQLSVSYMEIYKDECYDLLGDRSSAPKLPVRENDSGVVFVANLSAEPILSVSEFDSIYSRANKNRSVGATLLNRASSRSHAILTIEAAMVDEAENKIITGKINLVDLAGSENNKLTGNDQTRMAESAAINKSLSVLGQVVHALNQNASRIPYRNSKLTRILQDALGGNSVGLLICNIAPGTKFRQDTLNTLNFATRTKNIENKPVINEKDTRPAPKPHFAAVAPRPSLSRPAPAALMPLPTSSTSTSTSISTGGNGANYAHSALVAAAAAASGAQPRPRASLLPRPSIGMGMGVGNGYYQPFVGLGPSGSRATSSNRLFDQDADAEEQGSRSNGSAVLITLSEKEIDERISRAVERAVESEVSKRLEAREREKQEEEERRLREQQQKDQQEREKEKGSGSGKENSIPPGLLTPLLKRQRDLDEELRMRLVEVERKLEHEKKEAQLADVLSPVSKKKTGRAYVALARAHSEKGDLQVALELYRKAESYVPDNIKLKERIIEVEWAINNGLPFDPLPKKQRKSKSTTAATPSSAQQHLLSIATTVTGSATLSTDGSSVTTGKRQKKRNRARPTKASLTVIDEQNEGHHEGAAATTPPPTRTTTMKRPLEADDGAYHHADDYPDQNENAYEKDKVNRTSLSPVRAGKGESEELHTSPKRQRRAGDKKEVRKAKALVVDVSDDDEKDEWMASLVVPETETEGEMEAW